MSLSGIKLPGSVIAGLYKQTLVQQQGEIPDNPVVATSEKSEQYAILGNNHRHIAIVVNFPGDAFLPDNHLRFLTRMLEACKLNLGDVAIVNHAVIPVNMDRLRELLYPEFVLLFGVEPVVTGLPLNFPAFKDQAFAGCTYLFTPGLEELNQDNEEGKLQKSKLWVCLRKVFNV